MIENKSPKVLAFNPDLWTALGGFQVNWAGIELITDYAICLFLEITYEQTHLITSGMMFGSKAKLLSDLISKSDHANKAAIKTAFNKIRGDTKRDVFAHCYINSTTKTVQFIERPRGGEYRAVVHEFTLQELIDHTTKIARTAVEFSAAIGAEPDKVSAFAEAALSLSRKSKMSPHEPQDKE